MVKASLKGKSIPWTQKKSFRRLAAGHRLCCAWGALPAVVSCPQQSIAEAEDSAVFQAVR
eukprot:11888633-Prorocentrum_lima.AAC.1